MGKFRISLDQNLGNSSWANSRLDANNNALFQNLFFVRMDDNWIFVSDSIDNATKFATDMDSIPSRGYLGTGSVGPCNKDNIEKIYHAIVAGGTEIQKQW